MAIVIKRWRNLKYLGFEIKWLRLTQKWGFLIFFKRLCLYFSLGSNQKRSANSVSGKTHILELQPQTHSANQISGFFDHQSEAYSEPSQASKMELSVKIGNGFQPFNIFVKNSILDVWLVSGQVVDNISWRNEWVIMVFCIQTHIQKRIKYPDMDKVPLCTPRLSVVLTSFGDNSEWKILTLATS